MMADTRSEQQWSDCAPGIERGVQAFECSGKVSIIMPVFNTAEFIAESIQSIQRQTLTDWELLVIDDGSTDNSRSIVQSFAGEDHRIRMIALPQNVGPAQARNQGLAKASGRYIAFCDSDDCWLPEKLSIQLAFLKVSQNAVVCTGYARMNEKGILTGQILTPPQCFGYDRLLWKNPIGMSTVLIDRSRLPQLRLPDLPRRHDYALWLELAQQDIVFGGINTVLVHYRVRRRSVSSNKILAAVYHWRVLRSVARLSAANAAVLFVLYGWHGVKNRFPRL